MIYGWCGWQWQLLPSGNLLDGYGTWHIEIVSFPQWKWWFSIAMLVYQRVVLLVKNVQWMLPFLTCWANPRMIFQRSRHSFGINQTFFIARFWRDDLLATRYPFENSIGRWQILEHLDSISTSQGPVCFKISVSREGPYPTLEPDVGRMILSVSGCYMKEKWPLPEWPSRSSSLQTIPKSEIPLVNVYITMENRNF